MKALILAAGIASRLRPLTNDVPKCLLKVGDRCLLQRTFDALIANGITEFVVVLGYRQNQIKDFLNEKYSNINIEFIYNARYESTNNIYSLWLAKYSVAGREFLLMDSDILFDPQIITEVLNAKNDSVLALNRHELGDEEIKVIVDKNMQVTEISKVCSAKQAIGESLGIERMSAQYSSALFAELDTMIDDEHLDNVFYELAFERLTKQGHSFGVVDITKYFSLELDTVEDFTQAKKNIPSHLY